MTGTTIVRSVKKSVPHDLQKDAFIGDVRNSATMFDETRLRNGCSQAQAFARRRRHQVQRTWQ